MCEEEGGANIDEKSQAFPPLPLRKQVHHQDRPPCLALAEDFEEQVLRGDTEEKRRQPMQTGLEWLCSVHTFGKLFDCSSVLLKHINSSFYCCGFCEFRKCTWKRDGTSLLLVLPQVCYIWHPCKVGERISACCVMLLPATASNTPLWSFVPGRKYGLSWLEVNRLISVTMSQVDTKVSGGICVHSAAPWALGLMSPTISLSLLGFVVGRT